MKYVKLFEDYNNDDQKFDDNKLFNLLNELDNKGILDKVMQKISDNEETDNNLRFVMWDGIWTLKIYKGKSLDNVLASFPLQHGLGSVNSELLYNSILKLYEVLT